MDVQGDSLVERFLFRRSPQVSGESGMPVWDAEQLRLAITLRGRTLAWNVDTNRSRWTRELSICGACRSAVRDVRRPFFAYSSCDRDR